MGTAFASVVRIGLALLIIGGVASCTVRGDVFDPVDAHLDTRADASASACTVDSQCADRLACTIDHCVAGACQHAACTDCCGAGLMCDPATGCTRAAEPCTTDAECMDDQPCTLDRCRDGRLCEHQPMDGLCPFGQICIGSAGCVPEPPDTCETDEDCEAIGFCYGTWDCATELGCAYVGPRDCDDGDDCTADRCDGEAGACAHDVRDVDADTYADDACDGDDCDDSNDDVHPGATEACNGTDDDCDTHVDEGCCAAGPCTTACGTMGMTSCNPDGTVGPCMPPVEICDGNDQDCDSLVDETFECVRGATTSCSTGCGSMGMTTCDATCHAGACTPPPESCNASDDDCDGAVDDGFACVMGTSMACPTTCGSMGSRMCGGACTYDTCIPPPEVCNGSDDDCDSACDDGFTCCAGATRDCTLLGFYAGSALCRGDCSSFDTSTCTNCGNGTRDTGEACDGVALGGATCASQGFAGGTLRCAPGCVFDTSSCTNCGNGAVDAGEQCDGSALAGQTCASRGFASGTLSCRTDCTFDTSACSNCGNGTIDPPEQCDGTNLGGQTCTTIAGGFTGGALRCAAGCTRDTSMCTTWTPNGTYTTAPRPAFSCTWHGFPAVSFNIGSFGFIDDGVTLRVTGARCGSGGAMVGPSARTTRTFDVQCTYTGSCDEQYRLVGSFTSDNVWSGTFTAFYTGDCDTCDDAPNPRSFSVTGTRP